VTKTIGTGGDYSTLALWIAACPANLVTSDQIWRGELKNQEFTGTATLLTISGIVTNSTHYMEVTTEAGASFRDHASAATNSLCYDASKGAGLRSTSGSYFNLINSSNVSYTRISNIQFKTHASTVMCIGMSGASSTNHTLRNLICQSPNRTLQLATSTIIDILSISTGAGASPAVYIMLGGAAYGCTIVLCSDKTVAGIGLQTSYGTLTVKNTAVFGFSSFASGGTSASYTNTYCASDVTITGTNNQASKTYTSQFVGTTSSSPDFRALSTGDLHNGTPDATNTPTDIIGQTRDATTPYIGCWEVMSGGGGTVIPVFMNQYRQRWM
jgi:hypothetical protein